MLWIVRETSLTAFATVARVTAARSRSVWYAPPTGWVTVLAGLLARGSAPEVQPSQFPSGSVGRQARRLQLRGQPRWRLLTTAPCSLLPPRLAPRNQHTVSILLACMGVKMSGKRMPARVRRDTVLSESSAILQ